MGSVRLLKYAGLWMTVSAGTTGCAPAPVTNPYYQTAATLTYRPNASNTAPKPQFYQASYQPQNTPGYRPYLVPSSIRFNPLPSPISREIPNRNNGAMPMPADVPIRRALLSKAQESLGIRYKYGGTGPYEGFDCSGLTSYIYKYGNGMTLPRTAAEQAKASRTINFAQMRPGDLIFFRTSGSSVNHVGIYVGRGNFIHAASGGGKVSLDNLDKPYWQQRLIKFGTFLA